MLGSVLIILCYKVPSLQPLEFLFNLIVKIHLFNGLYLYTFRGYAIDYKGELNYGFITVDFNSWYYLRG